MPRTSQSPIKGLQSKIEHHRVSVVMVVYIPALEGYWTEALDVLRVCIQSILVDRSVPFNLCVFDNGSCTEVRRYLDELLRKGHLDVLVLFKENVGKVGGWNFMLPNVPGEIVAFTDSDVLFYPGWLRESLRVLESFGDVGMITARPFR